MIKVLGGAALQRGGRCRRRRMLSLAMLLLMMLRRAVGKRPRTRAGTGAGAGATALEIDAALCVRNVRVVILGAHQRHTLQRVALEGEIRIGCGLREILELAQTCILAQLLCRRRQIDRSVQCICLGALEETDLLLHARRDRIMGTSYRRSCVLRRGLGDVCHGQRETVFGIIAGHLGRRLGVRGTAIAEFQLRFGVIDAVIDHVIGGQRGRCCRRQCGLLILILEAL